MTQSETDAPRFYPNLEAGRGIAALMVSLFHAGQATYVRSDGVLQPLVDLPRASWADQIIRIIGNGPGAVVFFFVLSGFVLTKVLFEKRNVPSFGFRFVRARFFRIYPAVFSTICAFVIIFAISGRHISSSNEYSLVSTVLNALLLKSSIDGVTWSLQVEMAAIPLLLILFSLWRGFGAWPLWLVGAILLPLSFMGWWNRLFAEQGSLGQIYAFVAGMAVYLYGRQWVENLHHPKVALALSILLFVLSRAVIGWSSFWTPFAETIACSLIVALLAFGPNNSPTKTPIKRLCSFMGRISFSFYLLHPLSLLILFNISDVLTQWINVGTPRPVIVTILFIASTAAIIPLAWLQYRLVERPAILAGKRDQQSRPAKSPATTSATRKTEAY